jgi:hypothetical protein
LLKPIRASSCKITFKNSQRSLRCIISNAHPLGDF